MSLLSLSCYVQVPDRPGRQEDTGKIRERGQREEQRDVVLVLGPGHQPGGTRQGNRASYMYIHTPVGLSLCDENLYNTATYLVTFHSLKL